MRKFKCTLLTLLLSLSFVLPAFAAQNKSLNVLFLQSAHAAQITVHKKHYKLILKNVDSFVSYFSDRPARVTGLMPIEKFIARWHHSRDNFAKNPPNVAIESFVLGRNGHRKPVAIFATLKNPHYDAKKHSITYELNPLAKNKMRLANMKLGYTVVFFDDAVFIHWNPGRFK